MILTGISRSSKTPTSIYLANRGIKTANVPIVPNIPAPKELETVTRPLVVGLIASAERIAQIRRHRLLAINEHGETDYVDQDAIAAELAHMRKLCAASQLADHRCHPALDRGNCRRGHQSAARTQ